MTLEEMWYRSFTTPMEEIKVSKQPVYACKINGKWHAVTEFAWRSWTGERRVDGKNYYGDAFYLGSDEVAIRR